MFTYLVEQFINKYTDTFTDGEYGIAFYSDEV